MGFAKEMQMWAYARGFWPVQGTVCVECVDDEALKAYIREEAEETECTFCGRRSPTPIATDADSVVDHVSRSVRIEFADPNDELPWDEGDFVGEYFQFDGVLDALDEPLGSGEFREAVVRAGTDRAYCERDYHGTRIDEALQYDWDLFVNTVEREARYMFLWLPAGEEDEDMIRIGHAVRRGGRMLHEIGRLIRDVGLVETVRAEIPLFRARTNDRGATYSTAKDLGSAPYRKAAANRMSPAGIPMFYGATERDTAIEEVRQPNHTIASVGRFETESGARVVALDRLPDVPSLFDERRRHLRPALRFLHGFRYDFAKRIERDGREHVEYVPTQIVTEYLRHIFNDDDGEPVDGVAYTSAQVADGRCIVLFADADRCVELGEPASADGLRLVLRSYEHVRL